MAEASLKIVLKHGSLEKVYVMLEGKELAELEGCRGMVLNAPAHDLGSVGLTMDPYFIDFVEAEDGV